MDVKPNDGDAYCDQCGWVGLMSELEMHPEDPTAECCPECASKRTWWGSPDWADDS